jgi:hypothetical protein
MGHQFIQRWERKPTASAIKAMRVRGAHVQLQLTLQLEARAADGAVELLLSVLRLHASVTPGSVFVQRNHLDGDRQVNFQ